MKRIVVSTREISRGLTKLLRAVVDEQAEITVTSRGRPIAVLCPYDSYRQSQRKQAFERLMELADRHLTGLTLRETYRASRDALESRPGP